MKMLSPKSKKSAKQKGQVTTELVLMIVVMFAVTLTVSTAFRNNEFLASLVSGPWNSLSGMIQNGVWGDPIETMKKHPNQFRRVSTVRGDPVQ